MTTVNYQIDADGGDGYETSSGLCKTDLVSAVSDAVGEIFAFRWTGVTIPDGATIDLATIDCYMWHGGLDEPNHKVDFEDALSPSALVHDASTASSDYSSRTGTTATVTAGDGTDQGGPGWFSALTMGAVDVTTIIQELVDSYNYASGSAMLCRIEGGADAADDLSIYMHPQSATYGAKLHIEYTEGGVPSVVPVETDLLHDAAAGVLTHEFDLTPTEAAHLHDAAAVVLAHKFASVPVETDLLHDAAVIALTPKYALTPTEANLLHDAAVVALTASGGAASLTPVEANLLLDAAVVALTPSYALVPVETYSSHGADAVQLSVPGVAAEGSNIPYLRRQRRMRQREQRIRREEEIIWYA